jgi:uncharacterized membrane protein YagU involved in acid resistance
MNEFSSLMRKAAESASNGKKSQAQGNGQQRQEDPTLKTADVIAKTTLGIHLNQQQKRKAGSVVHYAFGAVMGGVYGAAAEYLPKVKSLAGVPYGAALFVGVDELALPLSGLSQGPAAYPLSRHLSGFAQHCVYGLTTEVVRRAMRDNI